MRDKITASLTTIKGREQSLKDVVISLLPQVDRLNVYLHGYTEIPDFLRDKKIVVAYGEDHGDLDKFYWVKETKGYHFICDDDLIYPSDYIKTTIQKIKKNGLENVYSYHGSNPYRLPIASYYHDRIVYHCLGDVQQNVKVKILGTGVLAYYTKTPYEFSYERLISNMADIHFSAYLLEMNKQLIVLEHKQGWIKHSEKVNPEETIFNNYVNSDYIQTTIINRNSHLFQTPKVFYEYPLVSIVVIVSRLRTHRDIVKQCFDSIRNQLYPNTEVLTIDNNDKLATIGKCYNDAVKQAKGKYILFVGDDDYIAPDYLFSLVHLAEHNPNEVSISSYLIMFNEEGTYIPKELIPTGLWRRDYLLANPFAEYLTRFVDSDAFERLKDKGLGTLPAINNYGYFYRVHNNQISGKKDMGVSHISETRREQINPLLQKIRDSIKESYDDTELY